MNADEISLKRMQNNCSVTLERYVDIAKATCEMFNTLRKLPVSKDRRLAIHLQKKREDEALAAYQKAASGLVNAVQADLSLEAAPRPAAAEKARGARHSYRRRGIGT